MNEKIRGSATFLLTLACCLSASAQDVQVSRTNRTVTVEVTESITKEPDMAEIGLGYHNYGASQEQAFDENVRTANKIIQSLTRAGVPQQNIETQNLSLNRTSNVEGKPELKRDQQFEAVQTWTVRVPAKEAQRAVDLAVAAGANQVEEPQWTVSDPMALDSEADSAAVAKARTVAEKMARDLGSKLGELLYASNTRVYPRKFRALLGTSSAEVMVTSRPEPKLKLFPKKVERQATVHAVFAIE